MSKILFRVVDIETTGYEPPSEVIEVGVTDLLFDPKTKATEISRPLSFMFSPTEPIQPENRAVHHITDADLAGAPVCTPDHLKGTINHAGRPYAFVAHNAAFERQWFTDEILGEGVYVIDTFKVALRCYAEAPAHSNQVLRYWLDLDLDADLASPPHRGGPDSYVTAHILARMLQTERVADLVGWTRAPRYYHTCPLAKHKGQRWCDIPFDYLQWIVFRSTGLEEDLKAAAREEMELRKAST